MNESQPDNSLKPDESSTPGGLGPGAGAGGPAPIPLTRLLSDRVASHVAATLDERDGGAVANGAWAEDAMGDLAGTLAAADPRFHKVPKQVDEILRQSPTTPYTQPPSNPQGTPMSDIASIDYQLDLLAQLDAELQRVQDDMEGMVGLYQQRLHQLAEAGMVPQLWDDFHNNVFEETRAQFARLRDKIQAVDRVKVRDYIARVENLRPN